MLSEAENQLLTLTGPETPMGRLMRRYWIPALLSSELAGPDSDPVRVTLLGERLVAFRDSAGQVGLLEENCPHRGASLYFGRNEDGGLRCVYHGWKFGITGHCLEMPNEPPESNFRDKVRARAYPCQERGGIVWAFMGEPKETPPLPELEFLLVPESQRYLSKRIQECNWLQALEGGLDSSHISFLHRGNYSGATQALYEADTAPRFEVLNNDFGMWVAARRSAGEDQWNWRLTPWLMPWYMMIPYPEPLALGGHCWIPIDDHNCWTWTFNWRPDRPLDAEEVSVWDSGASIHSRLVPGTFRPVANRENDYLIDREAQRRGDSFTGIFGSGEQDAAIQESMGPIYDRRREHLGSSDAAVIAARRALLKAVRDPTTAAGIEPATQHVRPVDMTLPREAAWFESTRERQRALVGAAEI